MERPDRPAMANPTAAVRMLIPVLADTGRLTLAQTGSDLGAREPTYSGTIAPAPLGSRKSRFHGETTFQPQLSIAKTQSVLTSKARDLTI
jgi:hypothetical protein